MTDVSSAHYVELISQQPRVSRSFKFAGKDLTEAVVKWPTVTVDSTKIRPGNLSLSVVDASSNFRFSDVFSNKALLVASCDISIHYSGVGANYEQTQFLSSPAVNSPDYYGTLTSISQDGEALAITDIAYTGVHLYRRNNHLSELRPKYVPDQILHNPSVNSPFIANHEFSGNKEWLIVGDVGSGPFGSYSGRAHLYQRQPLNVASNLVHNNGRVNLTNTSDISSYWSSFGAVASSIDITSGSLHVFGTSSYVGISNVTGSIPVESGHTYGVEFDWCHTSTVGVLSLPDVALVNMYKSGRQYHSWYCASAGQPYAGSLIAVSVAAISAHLYLDNVLVYDVDSVDNDHHKNYLVNGRVTHNHSLGWGTSGSEPYASFSYNANSFCVFMASSQSVSSAQGIFGQYINVKSGAYYGVTLDLRGDASTFNAYVSLDKSLANSGPYMLSVVASDYRSNKEYTFQASANTVALYILPRNTSLQFYGAVVRGMFDRYVHRHTIINHETTVLSVSNVQFGYAVDADFGGTALAVSATRQVSSYITTSGYNAYGTIYLYNRAINDASSLSVVGYVTTPTSYVNAFYYQVRLGDSLNFAKGDNAQVAGTFSTLMAVAPGAIGNSGRSKGALAQITRDREGGVWSSNFYINPTTGGYLGGYNDNGLATGTSKLVRVNNLANMVLIGCPNGPGAYSPTAFNPGEVVVYASSGSSAVLTYMHKILSPSPVTNQAEALVAPLFGRSVGLCANSGYVGGSGTSVEKVALLIGYLATSDSTLVQTPGYAVTGNARDGRVGVYRYNATTLTASLVGNLAEYSPTSYNHFGASIALTANGKSVVVGVPYGSNSFGHALVMHYDPHLNFETTSYEAKDTLSLYQGYLESADFAGGKVNLSFSDKYRTMGNRSIGTNEVPVDFNTASVFPGDLFLAICSYGGLSTASGAANTDIDWESYTTWSSILRDDAVKVNARFSGTKCLEALSKLGRITDSFFNVERGKIYCHRWSYATGSAQFTFDAHIIGSTVQLDKGRVINEQVMLGGYNVESESYTIQTTASNSSSRSIYGTTNQTENDPSVWLVDSVSCLNFCQRKLLFNDSPKESYSIKTTLAALPLHVGQLVTYVDSYLGINKSVLVTALAINVDNMSVSISADPSLSIRGFFLDISTLNNLTDRLT